MASGSLAGAPAAGSSAAAAAAASDSRQLVVPPPRPGVAHLCVEYPGYVGDETKVLETLGGTDGIARQLQENSKQLALRLRPHDHNCHPAYGAREPSRRLLLRLTRPAPAAEGSGASASSAAAGGWEAEVVATLPHTYRFSSPSDYQYVAHDSRPVDEQGLNQQQGMNPPGFQQQSLLCAPPLFAKQPQFDYAFRGHVSAAPAGGSAGGAAATAAGGRKKGGHGIMASFFDMEVPAALPEAQLAAAAATQPDMLSLLRALLAQRPVWPAAALHEAVAAAAAGGDGGGTASSSGRYPIDDVLQKLCYKFRNGPWKNAWTQRGFDPRINPEARRWQCIEYHLPSEWWSKIAEHKKAAALAREQQQPQPSGGAAAAEQQQQVEAQGEGLPPLAGDAYSSLLRFEAVPSTQSCSLQLCGVADSVVQQLLADPANHIQHCSDISGWLASAAHEAIKRRIKERFQAVLAGSPIQDDGGIGFGAGESAGAAVAGAGLFQQQQQQGQQHAMQMDAAAPAPAGAAGGEVAPMEVDADLAADPAQQAQQQLHIQQHGPSAAAAGAGVGAAGLPILPTRFMASLHDYLAAQLPEDEEEDEQDEEEDEEDGHDDDEGGQSDEGYQTEGDGAGGGAAAESEEEGDAR